MDVDLRELEREAATGNPTALAKLQHVRARCGNPEHTWGQWEDIKGCTPGRIDVPKLARQCSSCKLWQVQNLCNRHTYDQHANPGRCRRPHAHEGYANESDLGSQGTECGWARKDEPGYDADKWRD